MPNRKLPEPSGSNPRPSLLAQRAGIQMAAATFVLTLVGLPLLAWWHHESHLLSPFSILALAGILGFSGYILGHLGYQVRVSLPRPSRLTLAICCLLSAALSQIFAYGVVNFDPNKLGAFMQLMMLEIGLGNSHTSAHIVAELQQRRNAKQLARTTHQAPIWHPDHIK